MPVAKLFMLWMTEKFRDIRFIGNINYDLKWHADAQWTFALALRVDEFNNIVN